MGLLRSHGAAYIEKRWNVTKRMSFSTVKQTSYGAIQQAFAVALVALHVYYVHMRHYLTPFSFSKKKLTQQLTACCWTEMQKA